MFEDLIKEMERLNGQSLSVPIDSDEKGYTDKQCPSEECEFIFKVNEETGRIFLKMKLFGVLFVVTKPQQISGLLLSKLNMQKRKPSLLFKEKYTML